jgi:retinol dehydrogenase-16
MVVVWWFIFIVVLTFLFKRYLLEKLIISKLNARHVFITGCDSGFGHLLAVKLVSAGIPTFAGCYTEKGKVELTQKCKNLSGQLWTVSLDVTDSKSVSSAYDSVKQQLHGNGLWGLVCNAGIINTMAPDDWLNVDDYKNVVEVNTYGVIRTCQTFKPLIKKTKGRIVIITSVIGRVAPPTTGPYAVSKYAAEAYADILRREGKPFGFTVHILEPSLFKTTMLNIDLFQKGLDRLWRRLSDETKTEYGEEFYTGMKNAVSKNISKNADDNLNLVVDTYYHALTARYPRLRYYVGNPAVIFYIPLSFLPTFLQDLVFVFVRNRQNVPTVKATL